jgi:DNA-binding GntR family transcriptional regulator
MLRYRIESIYTTDNVLRAIGGHKAILRAVERADREGVGTAIAGHLEQSKKDILQYAFKETNSKFEARNPKQTRRSKI